MTPARVPVNITAFTPSDKAILLVLLKKKDTFFCGITLDMGLEDISKKVQYVVLDSRFVNGTNNVFSLDLTLKSNTHVEDMSRVIGVKMVDFYITQIGEKIGRAHVRTPVTSLSRMPSSA